MSKISCSESNRLSDRTYRIKSGFIVKVYFLALVDTCQSGEWGEERGVSGITSVLCSVVIS